MESVGVDAQTFDNAKLDKAPRFALFFDLDGTLVKGIDPPSRTTVDELRRVRKKGNLIFICTGRVPCFIPDSVYDVGFDGVVAAGGGFVSYYGDELHKEFLDHDMVLAILSAYDKMNLSVFLEGENALFSLNSPKAILGMFPVVDSVADFEQGGKYFGEKIYKLSVYKKVEPQFLKEFSKKLHIIDMGHYHEIVPLNSGKAAGMKIIMEKCGLDSGSSIAFGDSANDVDMLKFAGVGIAMGNAPAHVKSVADRITAEFEKDGVAVALKIMFP